MSFSRTDLLNQLREMDVYEFEKLVADVWSERGWDTTVTTSSNDRGIDVIAQKHSPFNQKQLLQAKRYTSGNKIGSPDIQQYSSLRHQQEDVDAVVIVTTSSFSRQAHKIANDLNVKLINGKKLVGMIFDIDNFQSILSDYGIKVSENVDDSSFIETSTEKTIDQFKEEMRKRMNRNNENNN